MKKFLFYFFVLLFIIFFQACSQVVLPEISQTRQGEINLPEQENPIITDPVIDFKPIQEYEHYVINNNFIYGINKGSVFSTWSERKVFFIATIDGVDVEYVPSKFFKSSERIFIGVTIEGKEYSLCQEAGSIIKIESLPEEPHQSVNEFSGPVGCFSINYKAPPYEQYKVVAYGDKFVYIHEHSTFAYPVSNDIILKTPDGLFTFYVMANGCPAMDNNKSLLGEVKIF